MQCEAHGERVLMLSFPVASPTPAAISAMANHLAGVEVNTI